MRWLRQGPVLLCARRDKELVPNVTWQNMEIIDKLGFIHAILATFPVHTIFFN